VSARGRRPAPKATNPWVVRGIAIVAGAVLVAAIVVAAAQGVLFTAPGGH
jgi:hypothetical protein